MADVTAAIPEFLPPKQREGETATEYVARAEWHRSRVPKEVLYAPIQGHVAGATGIQHWSRADYIGRAGTGYAQQENARVFNETRVPLSVFAPLPELKKRTPQERISEVRDMLNVLALQSYVDGAVRLPQSVNDKLVRLGIYPDLDSAKDDNVEQVLHKFDLYARALLEEQPNSDRVVDIKVAPSGDGIAATSQEVPANAGPGQKG